MFSLLLKDLISDFYLHVDGTEAMWLEVKNNKKKAFMLGYAYRTPSSHQSWKMNFEKIWEQVYTENRDVILLGDFNLNLLDISSRVRTCIHVNPPGSSRSLLEMQPDSHTPGSETEPPGCENTKKKTKKNFFSPPRPSFLRICMVITVTCCWKAINS